MTLAPWMKFAKSKSARALLAYLLICIVLSGLTSVGFYRSNLSSFEKSKSEEKIRVLELIDAFVTEYAADASPAALAGVVPATFRAHAIERFNRAKGPESEFMLRWVGRRGREIATAPGDERVAATIEGFSTATNPQPVAQFIQDSNETLFRTIYPSLARERSCVDCHNEIKPLPVAWRLNDVMGAFVIDVPMGPFLTETRRQSLGYGAAFFLALAAVGFAFSILHFRQMEAREAAELELARRVDERTVELQNARTELMSTYQRDVRYLDWLRRLAAFLRHEVRQPVAQITSSIELMQLARKEDESVRAYAASAFHAAQHVWNLVERASRATDAEAFVRQSKAQRVELSELLRDLVSGYRQTYSGIDFLFRSAMPVWISADPMLITEAVGNLLANAASFARENSAIEVNVMREGDHAVIEVSNSGPPISGEPDALFGPFASTRSGPSSEHHGLGLYLVRLVSDHYGGSATIANLADRSGVVAAIRLPAETLN